MQSSMAKEADCGPAKGSITVSSNDQRVCTYIQALHAQDGDMSCLKMRWCMAKADRAAAAVQHGPAATRVALEYGT